jgi:hypothetical protein
MLWLEVLDICFHRVIGRSFMPDANNRNDKARD